MGNSQTVLSSLKNRKSFIFAITSFLFIHILRKFIRKRRLKHVREQCIALMVATAVGDAKGIPYKNKTNEDIKKILKKINIKESIYEKCDDNNPCIELKGYGPGKWTDGTQLSMAMMIAIAESNDIQLGSLDMGLVVREHICEWNVSVVGWGSTRSAIERLRNRSKGYRNSGNADAVGNSVLVKLAPLAYYYSKLPREGSSLLSDSRWDQIELLTRMTHNNSVAVVTSILLCSFEEILFRCDGRCLESTNGRITLLNSMLDLSIRLERTYFVTEQDNRNFISNNLRRMEKILKQISNGTLTDEQLLELSHGGTKFCVDSCTMVMGIVLGSEKLNFQSIIRTVLIGGDTDSNAAMVGAIIGGVKGMCEIPASFIEQLHKHEKIINVGKKFSESITKLL